MEVRQLRPGLWRWTAPHPDWRPSLGPSPERPGGWAQYVGCVYYERPEGVVLVDPLAPPDGTSDAERFWRALDRDVARVDHSVAVLLTNDWHERSAQALHERYREQMPVSVWAHEAARVQRPGGRGPRVDCTLTDVVRAGAALPGGVQAYEIGVPYASEVVYFLPAHGALVFGDCLVGAGEGRARVMPASWVDKDPETQERYRTRFLPALRQLLDLRIEMLLPSHGAPVLDNAHAALAEAIDAPAWGEA